MDLTTIPVDKSVQITASIQTGKQAPLNLNRYGQSVMVPMFQSQETIVGQIKIVPVVKRIEHNGIKIELVGQIETSLDRYEFMSRVRELDIPGDLYETKTYPFEFSAVEMPHETYVGEIVKLSYILKVTISGIFCGGRVFLVRNRYPAPSYNDPIQIEFGVENHFNAEVEYDKSMYHLKDVINGNIRFRHVEENKGIKSVHIEFQRIEVTNAEPDVGMIDDPTDPDIEKKTLAKVELKDGAPLIGESIPIRLLLSQYELTPSYNIHNRFSVKYYLQLVVADEDGQLLYSGKQEITMYRHIDNDA